MAKETIQKSNTLHSYIMCEVGQKKDEGRNLDSYYDLRVFETLDDFLKALHKAKEITAEEREFTASVYYNDEKGENI